MHEESNYIISLTFLPMQSTFTEIKFSFFVMKHFFFLHINCFFLYFVFFFSFYNNISILLYKIVKFICLQLKISTKPIELSIYISEMVLDYCSTFFDPSSTQLLDARRTAACILYSKKCFFFQFCYKNSLSTGGCAPSIQGGEPNRFSSHQDPSQRLNFFLKDGLLYFDQVLAFS